MSRYEQHLDEFGTALAAAARGRRRRPSRTRITLALAAVAVAVVAILAGLGPAGSGPTDTVGRALAAVTSSEVIHYRVARTEGPAEGEGVDIRVSRAACPTSTPHEVWQTLRPLRLRAVIAAYDEPRPEHCGSTSDRHGNAVSGPTDVSYADGTLTTYHPENRLADVISGYRPESNAAGAFLYMVSGLPSQEGVVAELQRMLADGRLSEVGTRTIDGRAVRTLSGVQPTDHLTGDTGTPPSGAMTRVTYDFDAESFDPVRLVTSYNMPRVDRGPDGKLTVTHDGALRATQLDFLRWETLPLDDEARARLRIDLPAGTAVTRTTQDELRREIARRTGGRAVTP